MTWFALVGGAAALVAAAILPSRFQLARPGVIAALAVAVLAMPVAVHGFGRWTAPKPASTQQLPPGLVHALRTDVPERASVFSHPETSYLVAAAAPVYIASAPPAHVADTKANRPDRRFRDAQRFMARGDLAIPRRYGAERR